MSALNEYEVGKPIGSGKFSVVYKARLKRDGTIVALKRVQIFDIMDQRQREKCLKEVKLLQSLDHPNIIKYIDSFIADNDLIIVVEWAELGDLRKLIRKAAESDTPIEEGMIWKYFVQIADALKYMHERRIMHRDLKPANVFITGSGYLKMGDLGLGRSFSNESFEAFSKVGTPLYMSPEVILGKGYDWQSDVWSLGCILYELACLRNPFKEDDINLYDLFKKINSCQYKPVPDNYSPQLRDLVSRILVVDPKARPNVGEIFEIARRETTKYMSLKSRVSATIVMEDMIEKLKLLDYERRFCRAKKIPPISRIQFLVPTMNPDRQWHLFVSLVGWLLSLNGVQFPDPSPFDEPNSIAQSIIYELKRMGFTVVDLSAPKLRQAYGDAVCYLLNSLLDRALVQSNFHFLPPIYKDTVSSNDDVAEVVNEEETDDIDDETTEAEESNMYAEYSMEEDRHSGKKFSPLENEKPQIVDPEEWRRETARVESVLREVQVPVEGWRDRIDRLQRLCKVVNEILPDLSSRLESLREDVQKTVESIKQREHSLNERLAPEASKYAEAEGRLKSVTESYNASAQHVSTMATQLSSLTDEAERVKDEMDSLQDRLSNITPLTQMKVAIRNLKNECTQLEISIGVIEQTLAHKRLKRLAARS